MVPPAASKPYCYGDGDGQSHKHAHWLIPPFYAHLRNASLLVQLHGPTKQTRTVAPWPQHSLTRVLETPSCGRPASNYGGRRRCRPFCSIRPLIFELHRRCDRGESRRGGRMSYFRPADPTEVGTGARCEELKSSTSSSPPLPPVPCTGACSRANFRIQ
jgi:hypothetical protein